MDKHIDAEAFKKRLIVKGFYPAIVARVLEEMPAADVEKVKQGEWINDRCTNCEKLNPTLDFNEYLMRYYSFYLPRCPYCGAYMKKE